MTLEILIAQYLETEEVIKPMLDSIAIQQGVNLNDINIIIANDGTNTILDDTFLESYPFHIDYYLKDHEGLSGTRNFLLDRAGANYIMFCDADDMFLYNNALNLIFAEIEKGEFDFFYPDFTEELRIDEDKSKFITIKRDCQVHGKVLRRQFLIDNKIRWRNELKTHDSRYFFTLCQAYTKPERIRYCEQPFYLWKYNENSTTQTEDWHLKTYSTFVLSIVCLVDDLITRGFLQSAETTAASFTYLTYFLYNSESWQKKENVELVENALEAFSKFYNKYSSLINLLTEFQLNLIIKAERNHVAQRQESTFLEVITFPKFIEKIKSIPIK